MSRAGARRREDATLFAAAALVAVGGLIYELILGTAASYLVGDSVLSSPWPQASPCSVWGSAPCW